MSEVHDAQWWLEPELEKHDAMLRVVRQIRANQEHIKLNDLLNMSLYSTRPASGFGYGTARRSPAMASRLTLNVVRNVIGSITSKIASKNKPKPTFLTEEGNYEQKIQAENLEKFVGGVFYETGLYASLPSCFRDACVLGTGCLKIYPGEGKVEVERVKQLELVVDDFEGREGAPRNLYQRKYYDRLVALAMARRWAGSDESRLARVEAAFVRKAAGTDVGADFDDIEYAHQTTADQILVTEGWHLGETDSAPGRHAVVVEGCTLLDEEWTDPFPFAFLRWAEDPEGFFGVGLAEELRGIQGAINKLLQQIERGHHLITGHWTVLQGSTITSQINNDLGAIVKHTGSPPTYYAPQIISPEVYNHLWQLYGKAFEICGISQMTATGMKPAGLDSGEAQRVYNDIQTERFLEVGQAYEEFVIESARQVIRCAKAIGGGYRVRSVDKGGIRFIKWSEVDLDEDSYSIRVYPTSLLPTTPAGKIQWAEDRIKSGLIPTEDALDIIDHPDTSAYARRQGAPRRIIERNISHMLKKGEPIAPEPADNHQLAMKLVNEAYAEARLDNVPETKLQLLRDYLAVTQSYLKPPPPVGEPAPPIDPMAAPPMAPPPMGPPPMGPDQGMPA